MTSDAARLHPWASLARRAFFATSAVLLAGGGLVLVYWGTVAAIVAAGGPWWAVPLTPIGACIALLPIAAAAAATVAALTDQGGPVRWAIRLAAAEILALAALYGGVYLVG